MQTRRRTLILGGAASAAFGPARAQQAAFGAADLGAGERLRDSARTHTQAARRLTELCTQIGARPAGSAADARAAAWGWRWTTASTLKRSRTT